MADRGPSPGDYRIAYGGWDAAQWAAQTGRFRCRNAFQTFEYGQAHAGLFRSIERMGVYCRGQLVAACQLHIKRLPLIGGGIAEAFLGPMWDPRADGQMGERGLRMLLEAIRAEYALKRNLEVRLRPPSSLDEAHDRRLVQILSEAGFEHRRIETDGSTAYRTILLDLSLSLEELRKNLHQSWRRHLNLAERAGLELIRGREAEFFDRFIAIYDVMWERKRFLVGTKISTLRRMHDLLSPSERFYITLVRQDGRDIAGSVCAVFGDTLLFYLGASLPTARKVNPGYLIQWAHLVQGKELSLRCYDTGGAPEDAPDITSFKMRMNGRLVEYPGHFIAPAAKGPSLVYRMVEKVRYRLRRLRGVKGGRPVIATAMQQSAEVSDAVEVP